jgi:hypothetical protein
MELMDPIFEPLNREVVKFGLFCQIYIHVVLKFEELHLI